MPLHTGCCSWLRCKSTQRPPPEKLVPAKGGSRQTLEILQRFSQSLPIPCANEALELALFLLTTHEDVTLVEQQVRRLKDRIAALMLVMVDELKDKKDTDVAPDVLIDIERLSRLQSQNRFLLIFFKNVNKSTMDQCLARLNDAMQTFHIGRTVHDGSILFEIQTRLQATFERTEIMAKELHEMHDWLRPKNSHSAKAGLSLAAMPSPLAHMFGRDDVVADIVRILTTHDKPRVVIHGAGGMGKTSVAVSAMEDKTMATRYDAKSSLLGSDTGDPLGDLISGLEASKDPRIMLLDNFETAWSLPEDLTNYGCISVEAIIDRLAAIPHLAILITIRANTFSSDAIDLDPLPFERAIFIRLCPTARDHPALDPLLDALGHMPYAITLLAKQSTKSGLPPDVLLEEWQKLGPDSLSGELKKRMNTSIEFSVESRSMYEDPNAQTLLAILSQLPNGTTSKHLKWWASSVSNPYGAIATLSDTALIAQHQEGDVLIYSVLPVVQSYLSQHNSPCTRSLAIAACYDDFKKQINILSIFLAESLILDAILELIRRFLDLFTPNGDPRRLRYIAEARFCLGKACTELEASRSSFRELGTPSDIIHAGECALELANSWTFTSESGDPQTDLKDDPKGAARALISLGENFRYMNSSSEGLKHLMIAHAALQDLNYAMSRCYAHLDMLTEWQRVAQASLEVSRLVGMDELITRALRALSQCYIRQQKYDDALGALREALGISEQLSDPLATAEVLDLSGHAYAKKRDFVGARLAFEEAKKVYAGVDTCERNLRTILERDSDGDIELDTFILY
ncbi:hypothetical protein F5887DRAFT_1061292 [Amanita rubescens]|nr:hypothetical protein F5887DRAFT_1061292 [Amanita rubescens]